MPSPRSLLSILALALTASCASTSTDYLRLEASAFANTIAVGDMVHITDGMTGHAVLASAPIAPDGTIEVPRLGSIQVEGWSADRLRRELDRRYRQMDVPTHVAVEVSQPGETITILGEVLREGRHPLEAGTTLSQAVARAEPDPNYADLFRVKVVRMSQGKELVQKIDLRRIEQGDRSFDLVLRDGDIIHIPVTAFGRALSPVRPERTGLGSSNPNQTDASPGASPDGE